MRQPKKQRGFTLIELIIVIVILGILAVVAAPRFIDVSSEARKASLQGVKGALKSQSDLAHIACVLTEGCTSAIWGEVIFVEALNQDVQILRGYPDAGEISRPDQIDDIIEVSGFDLSSEDRNETARWSVPGTTDCYVQYRQPARTGDEPRPTISVVDTGC